MIIKLRQLTEEQGKSSLEMMNYLNMKLLEKISFLERDFDEKLNQKIGMLEKTIEQKAFALERKIDIQAGKLFLMNQKIDGQADETIKNFSSLEKKIDAQANKYSILEGKIDAQAGKFCVLEGKIDAQTEKSCVLEGKIDAQAEKSCVLEGKIDDLAEKICFIEGKIDAQAEKTFQDVFSIENKIEIVSRMQKEFKKMGETLHIRSDDLSNAVNRVEAMAKVHHNSLLEKYGEVKIQLESFEIELRVVNMLQALP